MFRSKNPEIPDDFYGKWFEIFKTAKMPDKSDFNLPTTKEECDEMFSHMSSCGIDKEAGIKMLKERKEKYEAPVKEYCSKLSQN